MECSADLDVVVASREVSQSPSPLIHCHTVMFKPWAKVETKYMTLQGAYDVGLYSADFETFQSATLNKLVKQPVLPHVDLQDCAVEAEKSTVTGMQSREQVQALRIFSPPDHCNLNSWSSRHLLCGFAGTEQIVKWMDLSQSINKCVSYNVFVRMLLCKSSRVCHRTCDLVNTCLRSLACEPNIAAPATRLLMYSARSSRDHGRQQMSLSIWLGTVSFIAATLFTLAGDVRAL